MADDWPLIRVANRTVALRTIELARFERSWAAEGDCWIWKRARDPDGYGMFHLTRDGRKQMLLAHRVAYQLLRGPIAPYRNPRTGQRACRACRKRCSQAWWAAQKAKRV